MASIPGVPFGLPGPGFPTLPLPEPVPLENLPPPPAPVPVPPVPLPDLPDVVGEKLGAGEDEPFPPFTPPELPVVGEDVTGAVVGCAI